MDKHGGTHLAAARPRCPTVSAATRIPAGTRCGERSHIDSDARQDRGAREVSAGPRLAESRCADRLRQFESAAVRCQDTYCWFTPGLSGGYVDQDGDPFLIQQRQNGCPAGSA